MERAISEMERIKRAEEIYSKRKNPNSNVTVKEKNKSIYKNLFQVLLLVNIAIVFVAFQNRDYIFSNEFIEMVGSYNINIRETIEGFVSNNEETEENINEYETNEEDLEETENGIGGSSEQESNLEEGALVENESSEEISQMELDAQNILINYSVILPVNGTKTSGFGIRESNNSIVTKNHTGVDIGATTGTAIKAAISGTVTGVSEEGDYGKHFKITNGSLTTLYAHCSEIYVSEGQEVSQGDEVAAVGSTGNSTGPHLHFEIIYEERYVDPELIIEI